MEFHENMRFMKSLPLEPVGDVLVIAGDVGYLVDSTIPHLRFWKWASENYRQVLMMIGSTHLVSNPLGYIFCGENSNFNDSALIEV